MERLGKMFPWLAAMRTAVASIWWTAAANTIEAGWPDSGQPPTPPLSLWQVGARGHARDGGGTDRRGKDAIATRIKRATGTWRDKMNRRRGWDKNEYEPYLKGSSIIKRRVNEKHRVFKPQGSRSSSGRGRGVDRAGMREEGGSVPREGI